jgi:regulator of protease activity HflC (stomatin/prohibitin superfamily)
MERTVAEFFGKILEFIHQLWPLRIVRVYQAGVRFWMGCVVGEQLGAGLYWFLPFFGAIEIVDTVEDVMDLPVQSVTTKDGKSVMFSANVSYMVTDAKLLYTEVQDFEENLQRIATGHLALRVREWTWDELQEGQRKLEISLRDTLTTRVKGWGSKIIECRLTDCVQAKQFRLLG